MVQRVSTNRAIDIHHFAFNMRKFLLTTNYGTHLISIYEWKNERFDAKIQDISINFSYKCDTFLISNTIYIACGRGQSAALMQPQFSNGQEADLNCSKNFPRCMSTASHTASTLTALFSLPSQITKLLMILIRTFTDGMAPSLSNTSPSRLIARTPGINFQPPKATCS